MTRIEYSIWGSKSVCAKAHMGSNPIFSAKLEWKVSKIWALSTFLLRGITHRALLSWPSWCWNSKPGKNRIGRGNLGAIFQMSINVRRRRKITVPKPFLDLLHWNTVRQHQRSAGVPQIVETNMPHFVFFEKWRKAWWDIIRLYKISDLVHTNVALEFPIIASAAQSSVFFLLFLKP